MGGSEFRVFLLCYFGHLQFLFFFFFIKIIMSRWSVCIFNQSLFPEVHIVLPPSLIVWVSFSFLFCLQCGRPGFSPWVGKIPWRRKWQPTPVLLPGKSHGQRSLVGYSPWGCRESDMTERLHFHFHTLYNFSCLINSKVRTWECTLLSTLYCSQGLRLQSPKFKPKSSTEQKVPVLGSENMCSHATSQVWKLGQVNHTLWTSVYQSKYR